MPNRLIHARSPYLRKAAFQSVDWHEWGEEAFERAHSRNLPIFLSIGGTWCHWCHVMAHECFDNPDIADLINRNFIPVKVDRDERPDIDRRYQDVVIAISGSGGWPLTVLLTPDGKAFYGGTYFPPETRGGRPGLPTILRQISALYEKEPWRIETIAEEMFRNFEAGTRSDTENDPNIGYLENVGRAILGAHDAVNGGIGTAPKFHHVTAFEYLLAGSSTRDDGRAEKAVSLTLAKMAQGGIHDHIGGGFFRYSTDERWIVPHFEKMLADNASLIRLFANAYRVYPENLYGTVCERVVSYYRKHGTHEGGAFFASQDADIGMLDEGGYYTFTITEIREILTPAEAEAAVYHYGITSEGNMPHDPGRNVLFINRTIQEVAREIGKTVGEAESLLLTAREKMLTFRETREKPFIDETVYTNLNGLMIEALSAASVSFGRTDYLDMAERAARYILHEHYAGEELLHTRGVSGFAEDSVFFAKGLLSLAEASQNDDYIHLSDRVMEKAIELFWDAELGGFFDAGKTGQGYLRIRMKNIHDAPVESANGSAPLVFLQLAALTGKTEYEQYAEKILRAFANVIRDHPLISPSYALSLDAYFSGFGVIETSLFFDEAQRDFHPFTFVRRKECEGVLVCRKNVCTMFPSYRAFVENGKNRERMR